ncbi:hypothetical protein DLAC_08588 [Tieghemostelium lacteum]|uniref:EGF-like domain-containing protein n=1 Tax=Tieghemostelium lacteum TaxID=361077 RepID=A0A151Z7S0_TIELA|nr:hypothetical protein DLAC_08588 [Tieghemostelium lacteum]|eukprot:KYQ90013.1 hypothetical protein DLAC_08588 [Tieghemostelium lacteum]
MSHVKIYVFTIFISLLNITRGYYIEDTTIPFQNNAYATAASTCLFSYAVSVLAEASDADIFCASVIAQVNTTGQIAGTLSIKNSSPRACAVTLSATVPINTIGQLDFYYSGSILMNGSIQFDCQPVPYPLTLLDPQPKFHMDLVNNYRHTALMRLNFTKAIDTSLFTVPTDYSCYFSQLNYSSILISCNLQNFVTINPEFFVVFTDPLGQISNFSIPTFLSSVTATPSYNISHYSTPSDVAYSFKQHYTELQVTNPYPIQNVYQQVMGVGVKPPLITYGNPTNGFTLVFVNYLQFAPSTQNYVTSYMNGSTTGVIIDDVTFSNTVRLATTTSGKSFNRDANSAVASCTFTNFDSISPSYSYGSLISYGDGAYPYGVVQRTGTVVMLEYVVKPTQYTKSMSISTYVGNLYSGTVTGTLTDATAPKLESLVYTKLSEYSYLVTIRVSDVGGAGFFSLNDNQIVIKASDIVSGTPINGTFEKYVDSRDLPTLYSPTPQSGRQIFDYAGNFGIYSSTSYGTPLPPYSPIYIPYNSMYALDQVVTVTHVSFTIMNIDLSIVGCKNTMFIKFSNSLPEISPVIGFASLPVFKNKLIVAKWSEKFERYMVDFEIPQMQFTDKYVPYTIYYKNVAFDSKALPDELQLKIKSTYADQMPPQVVEITTSPAITDTQGGSISWTFKISDPYNGFQNGTIKIVSNVDPYVPYVFEIKPSATQNPKLDSYTISIPIPPNCIPQNFYIKSIELMDNGLQSGIYTDNNYNLDTRVTPMLQFITNQTALNSFTISTDCGVVREITAPIMESFQILPSNTVDVSSPLDSDRLLEVVFKITDTQHDILLTRNVPYCYLHASVFEKLTFPSAVVSNTSLSATFKCTMQIPYGFGYGGPDVNPSLVVSIFGYTDTHLNVGGMSTLSLSVNFNPVINVTFSTTGAPFIQDVKSSGNTMTIVGKKFSSSGTVNIGADVYQVTPIGSSVIIINNTLPIRSISNVSVVINSVPSNNWLVQANSPSIPPEIPCPGEPQCGGPTNGKCSSGVCLCIKPWYGPDCNSQNIVKPPPQVNETNPDVDTDYNTTLPSGETVTLKSLIAFVSLKEMKPDGTVAIEHPFSQWVYTNTTSLQSNTNIEEYTYETNVTNNNVLTGVTVALQYFKQAESIIFANEKLEMLASTIKYRIDISRYQFSSALNTLQLVMSVALESQNSAVSSCSVQESGNADDENVSEFVKLQVDTHSLYGRFIKRGIVDNRVQQISNTIFSDSSSTNTQSQSYIGINIPNYKSSATLDPDFSVLIDTTPASQKSNSICAENNMEDKSKLSKTQLIGIIIGAVGFGLVIIVSIVYYVYKKRQDKRTARILQNKIANSQSR